MKRALYALLTILALLRWATTAHVTMQAGATQVQMPVLALAAVLAGCLAVAAAAFLGAVVWQTSKAGA